MCLNTSLVKDCQCFFEPFGIKIILIEPGAIGSNFMKGSVLSKRALDPQSPYSELVQKVNDKISLQHENATQPEEVAKTIVQAISTDKPEFRYVIGNDAVSHWKQEIKCHIQTSKR